MTDNEEPKRAKLRNDMAEPRCKKSNTDIEEDIRAIPKTEN
jgi:hypothetical protein